ncbi:uncharacterized protein LOC116204284 isoform X2 [Punica granatum]|nr:uncharacterized protein LOC116204284 isoform X2 [Punica granatum]
MLTYRRQRSREPVGSGKLAYKIEDSSVVDENLGGIRVDREATTCVKTLIEKEIVKEPRHSDSRWEGHLKKKNGKRGKTGFKQSQFLNNGDLEDGKNWESKCPCQQITEQHLENIITEKDIIKEFCDQDYPHHHEERLHEAVKQVLSQQLFCGIHKELVNVLQSSQGSHFTRDKLSNALAESDLSRDGKYKQLNFFGKEAGFRGIRSSDGDEHSQVPNTIVLLNPKLINPETAPLQNTGDKGRSERIITWSFLSSIRKRLKSAISSTKDRFYMEKVPQVKAGEENHKMGDNSDLRVSKIYIEAKKYLSEIPSDCDQGSEILTSEFSDKLGRILSLPVFSCSPIGSPKRDNSLTVFPKGECPRDIGNNVDSSTVVPGEQVIESSICGTVGEETAVVTVDHTGLEENTGESDEFSPENCTTGHLCEASDDNDCGQLMRKNLNDENAPVVSPFTSLPSAFFMEKAEQPSPVSVLEPLFTEDQYSPTRTKIQSRGHPIQLLQIEFDERVDPSTTQNIYTETLDIDCVKAVLHACKINWDELYLKSLSSDQLLPLTVLRDTDFFGGFPFHGEKILLDCINEVLLEFCKHYSVLPCYCFSNKINATHKVCERVHWHLLQPPMPRTLEQIVGKDLSGMEAWMDLRLEAENLGVVMGEIILEELIQDTIMDCVNEALESEQLPIFFLLGRRRTRQH